MLTNESNSSLSFIRILFGHVEIINEVDELGLTFRSPTSTSLLELRFQNLLKHVSISEEIEVNNLTFEFISLFNEIVKETLNDLSFTATGHTYKHRWDSNLKEFLHDVLRGNSIRSRNGIVGNGHSSVDTVFNIITSKLVPIIEFWVLHIDVVIENGLGGRELNNLEVFSPEFIELETRFVTFNDFKSSSHAPDDAENEDEFETLDIVLLENDLKKLADVHNLGNEYLRHNVFEVSCAVFISLRYIHVELLL
jgi:hypothetical protein